MAPVGLRVEVVDGKAVITFTKGETELLLRFPKVPTNVDTAGDDLTFLIENIVELVDSANLEIESALLWQEMSNE